MDKSNDLRATATAMLAELTNPHALPIDNPQIQRALILLLRHVVEQPVSSAVGPAPKDAPA